MLVICEYVIAYAITYFAKNLHITYFSAYNGIFKITYVKIMPHMQKFAYICNRIYAAYFRICNRIFQHFPCLTLF